MFSFWFLAFVKPFFFCCFHLLFFTVIYITFIFTRSTWYFSFFVIFDSSFWPIKIFSQSCCVLLNFFWSFDFKDASSLINASADVQKIPKFSKIFIQSEKLNYVHIFIQSWGVLHYFETFLSLYIGIGFCKDSSYWQVCKLFIWFVLFHFVLYDRCP